ncbi:hypothetical protein CANARDRAFT_14973 [[Candida] arabinofermentans NRRL YB-2248]|uniref:F-box domain-containing protein n=1 Tax=[Candida] arabinofermentans NRRL YB-2248 TaxID=983967 RepID=A0A1E4T7H3_9ASCO|nr:hypothetical protein CANARDRAFT_14973 [[Candida] arabinofermentans NRRL YB-2248]
MTKQLSIDSEIDTKTQTFIKLMTLFPLELQYQVISFFEWKNYSINSLLQLILDGPPFLQNFLVNKLFGSVLLLWGSLELGMYFWVEYDSDDFRLLLRLMKHLESQKNSRSEYTIDTLKVLGANNNQMKCCKLLFDNSRSLETSFISPISELKCEYFYTKFSSKIKSITFFDLESVDFSVLGSTLHENLEFLIFHVEYKPNKLFLIKKLSENLKSLQRKKKNLEVELVIKTSSVSKLDCNLLPSFDIPNLDITLEIDTKRELGRLGGFILSIGLENISDLSIDYGFDPNVDYFIDASIVELLSNLKVLKLTGHFLLAGNRCSSIMNFDELELRNGIVNLTNIISKKLTMRGCLFNQESICEGIEELTEYRTLNWDEVKLPSTLSSLHILDSKMGNSEELSFENNLSVFRDLINLKKLTIFKFYHSANLELPSNLQYFEFKSYYSDTSDTIDFDLPKSLKYFGANQEVLENLDIEKFPIGLEVLTSYVDVCENEFKLILPSRGLKHLMLKRLEMDDDLISNNEKITLQLANIKDLLKIDFAWDSTEAVSILVPDDEKIYLDKINISYDVY